MTIGDCTILDAARLKAPAHHGETLVAPGARALACLAHAWRAAPDDHSARLLDSGLSTVRQQVRAALAGGWDRPVVVVGHQPGFNHAGVWAKHVVADRLARAVGGVAINLVVDNDAPKRTTIAVPVEAAGRLVVRHLRYAELPSGDPFEHIPRQEADRIARFESSLRDALGARYEKSKCPAWIEGFRACEDARDWVDQAVAGRRAIEARFGIELVDHRISDVWGGPLLAEIILNADRFRSSYNRALRRYRLANRIRGTERPIPDLGREGDAVEVPVWVYEPRGRRHRLFARRDGERIVLSTDHEVIGMARVGDLGRIDGAEAALRRLAPWGFRPRALTLTLWARLLRADLFIHGIGGAKNDRITDEIIRDYYGINPPPIGCVSATLMLDLPHERVSIETVREAEHRLRDVRFNPQRHANSNAGLGELIDARADAVRRSGELRGSGSADRRARRLAFDDIRKATAAIFSARPELEAGARAEVDRLRGSLEQARIATDREYFFGLHDDERLKTLLDTLPSIEALQPL
jgi:hypothetical protein